MSYQYLNKWLEEKNIRLLSNTSRLLYIDNDSLTIQTSPSIIEGFYHNGSDTIKFGEMYINLFFESLNNFSQEPNECN